MLHNYLIVLPVSASIVQVQWRLLSYGAGYPGDNMRPDTAPAMWPPHSATRIQVKASITSGKKQTYFSPIFIYAVSPNEIFINQVRKP